MLTSQPVGHDGTRLPLSVILDLIEPDAMTKEPEELPTARQKSGHGDPAHLGGVWAWVRDDTGAGFSIVQTSQDS